MTDALLLKLCAAHSFGFAGFHLAFWKLFRWKQDLQQASFSTRVIVQILNLRLVYVFFAIGALCLAFPGELAGTEMGKAILAGMSLFWVGRTIEQFVFLRHDRPMIHALTAAFVIGAILFVLPITD